LVRTAFGNVSKATLGRMPTPWYVRFPLNWISNSGLITKDAAAFIKALGARDALIVPRVNR